MRLPDTCQTSVGDNGVRWSRRLWVLCSCSWAAVKQPWVLFVSTLVTLGEANLICAPLRRVVLFEMNTWS